jgi:hypothetical protein
MVSSPEREWRGRREERQGGMAGCVGGGAPWGVAALGRAADRILPTSVLFVQNVA